MSHSHEDRIADRPRHLCAAYGCPLVGTSTSSTSGADDWYCFAHFGAEFGKYQAITSELNRTSWLAHACRDVRQFAPGSKESKKAFQLITHELGMANRKDLLLLQGETRAKWLARLEEELRRIVRLSLPPEPFQQALPSSTAVGTFDKVEFDMPA